MKEKELLARYVDLARKEANTTFIGRLGTYRYLDMHVAISEALRAADRFIAANPTVQSMPAFTVDPLQ